MRYTKYALALVSFLVVAYHWPDGKLRIDGADRDAVNASLILVGAELRSFDRDLLQASYELLSVQHADDVFVEIDGLTAEELINAGLAAGKRYGVETVEQLVRWHFRRQLEQLCFGEYSARSRTLFDVSS